MQQGSRRPSPVSQGYGMGSEGRARRASTRDRRSGRDARHQGDSARDESALAATHPLARCGSRSGRKTFGRWTVMFGAKTGPWPVMCLETDRHYPRATSRPRRVSSGAAGRPQRDTLPLRCETRWEERERERRPTRPGAPHDQGATGSGRRLPLTDARCVRSLVSPASECSHRATPQWPPKSTNSLPAARGAPRQG